MTDTDSVMPLRQYGPKRKDLAVVARKKKTVSSAKRTRRYRERQKEHADYRAMLWHRLERIYEPKSISRNKPVRGSSDEWKFDAVVSIGSTVALFELVSPHVNAVSSAVTISRHPRPR